MSLKALHTASALIELGAGLGFLCTPVLTVTLLAGIPIEGPAALTVTRLGGAGLTTLGIACWLARGDADSRVSRGLVAAMLFYDIAAAGILAYAGLGLGLKGLALWPAVLLHVGMTGWCAAKLRQPGPSPEAGSVSG